MCDNCEKMNEVLAELTGMKVAGVIMRRVGARVHPSITQEAHQRLRVVNV